MKDKIIDRILRYLGKKKLMTIGKAYKWLHILYSDKHPPRHHNLAYLYWH